MPNDLMTEVAKELGKETVKQASSFIMQIIGEPLKELSGVGVDTIRAFRFRKQIELLNKTEALCKEKGVTISRIPLSSLYPLLETASVEEDENMIERWAVLLANAVKGSKATYTKSFTTILQSLSSIHVKMLDILFNAVHGETWKLPAYESGEVICSLVDIEESEYMELVDDLVRLNVIERYPYATTEGPVIRALAPRETESLSYSPGPFFRSDETDSIHIHRYRYVSLTSLGYSFVKSCRKDAINDGRCMTQTSEDIPRYLHRDIFGNK